MAKEAGKKSGIGKFDSTDFGFWRMQIEDYLYGKKLHLPLLRENPKTMKAEERLFLTNRYWDLLG